MALGDQQRGAGGTARDDGIGCQGGAEHEQVAAFQQVRDGTVHVVRRRAEGIEQADDRVGRRGGAFVQARRAAGAVDHQVGKGAAGIRRECQA